MTNVPATQAQHKHRVRPHGRGFAVVTADDFIAECGTYGCAQRIADELNGIYPADDEPGWDRLIEDGEA